MSLKLKARTGQIVAFGRLCNQVPEPGNDIPKRIKKKLAKFEASFLLMQDDEILGSLAKNRLAVLSELLKYCDTGNADHYAESVRLHDIGDKIADEVWEGGGV